MTQADPQNRFKKTVGFIVNPIAGMGGAVGLKGTDGTEILKKAVALGAKAVAPARAELFLKELEPVKEDILLLVGPGLMGETEAKNQGYDYKVFGEQKTNTKPEDTVAVAKTIAAQNVDLLVFCGGDGTARDVLTAVDIKTPVLGVPTGVKMHSAVFGIDPKSAARIASQYLYGFLPLWEAEVMDIDEEEFRHGRVSARLHGYLISPYEPHLIQGAKMASPMTESELRNQAAMAVYVIEEMKEDVVYIVSAGTTTRTIGDLLDQKKSLLGVDLFVDKKIVAKDVNEQQILEAIEGKKAKIIVTPIGGQGFVFGRGNQQISPKVIRKVGKENIIVVATENKMKHIRRLKVDTGDPKLDAEFAGTIKVVTDYNIEKVIKIE
ncbi:MAG: ATP-NAD kinase family protein [Candidatus Bathyarchaeota archaeon]|nr:ATP-NAD kinase family protein [Candidatus Bathyarchaeum tardum]WGM89044.1 MAG: ATP-NAD kinase family protein [Candidatus Bathyarchaeum tardum]